MDVLAVTHIADGLAWEVVNETPAEEPAAIAGLLNLEYLTQLGLGAQLPAWLAMAQQVHAEVQGKT